MNWPNIVILFFVLMLQFNCCQLTRWSTTAVEMELSHVMNWAVILWHYCDFVLVLFFTVYSCALVIRNKTLAYLLTYLLTYLLGYFLACCLRRWQKRQRRRSKNLDSAIGRSQNTHRYCSFQLPTCLTSTQCISTRSRGSSVSIPLPFKTGRRHFLAILVVCRGGSKGGQRAAAPVKSLHPCGPPNGPK